MIRRTLVAGIGLLAALALTSCGDKPDQVKGATPKELRFSILSAENQQSMQPLWQPLLDDMSQQVGIPVKPFFATNYTSLIEAMRFGQVQVGWFSALPALEAVRRADGQVLGRVIDSGGEDSYTSVLIVKKGSGITLERVLKCDKSLDFGIGDAKSTSGTLAPMTYLFSPRGIEPTDCFAAVRSASHQANVNSVAAGQLDVATNNSVGLLFARRDNPRVGNAVEVIWSSPPLPESSIVVKRDMDPALKEKIRQFFLTYGVGDDAKAEAQRKVLVGLAYGGFRPADDSYLDPIREMEASEALADARKSGDASRIKQARADYDAIRAKVAQAREREPAV
jgi:phosphonate transport system substrate-binding protein